MAAAMEQKVLQQPALHFMLRQIGILGRAQRHRLIGKVASRNTWPGAIATVGCRATSCRLFVTGCSGARTHGASRGLQHPVAGTLHVSQLQQIHDALVNTLEFAGKRGRQTFDPEFGNHWFSWCFGQHFAQHVGKVFGPQRIALGLNIGQALHRADEFVQLSQRQIHHRQHLLEQP